MARLRILSLLVSLISFLVGSQAFAQTPIMKEFVQFPAGAEGLYWVPSSGPISHIAFLAIHRTAPFLRHNSTEELPKRGFSVLGMNSRFNNNEELVNWELIALDVRAGVRFLRSQPGITKVILIGHSGGGPTTSYYQAVAENGPSYCQEPNKLTQCSSTQLAGFVPSDRADGIVFTDAHPGNGVNVLRSLNAALRNESNPNSISSNLDPFSVKNGFNPEGDSVYSARFVKRYTDAQSRRMNDLIETALQIKADIEAGKHVPTDNDVFVVYRNSARLMNISTAVQCCTLNPAKLLKNDGTIDATQVVRTVRVPTPDNREADARYANATGPGGAGTVVRNLTSFLSASAIRSTNSLDGIDWCSSNNSTPCAVANISVPILVVAAQGHYFIRDGEQIYEESASADRDFIVVEGMTHGLSNCTACAAFHGTGPYTNVPLNLWNYVANWANARF
jgi:pimeloyl-ACP methyl ester carboxylesterase